jgi:hypothetical protein
VHRVDVGAEAHCGEAHGQRRAQVCARQRRQQWAAVASAVGQLQRLEQMGWARLRWGARGLHAQPSLAAQLQELLRCASGRSQQQRPAADAPA